jgi:hypothetical protein
MLRNKITLDLSKICGSFSWFDKQNFYLRNVRVTHFQNETKFSIEYRHWIIKIPHWHGTRRFISPPSLRLTSFHKRVESNTLSYNSFILRSVLLPSAPRSFTQVSTFMFSNKVNVYISHLSYACYKPHPSHLPRFDHSNNIWRSYKLWSSRLCSFRHPPVTPALLGLPASCSQTTSISATHSLHDGDRHISETSVYYDTTRCHIPQGCLLHTRCRENLKSHQHT